MTLSTSIKSDQRPSEPFVQISSPARLTWWFACWRWLQIAKKTGY